MIDKIGPVQANMKVGRVESGSNLTKNIGKDTGPSFADILDKKIGSNPISNLPATDTKLKFSNHAIERIRSRGISMGANEMARLENAVSKAAEKGAQNTLVLLGESALIVNVKNKTVVTALDKNMMKENVFTNIDSTVLA